MKKARANDSDAEVAYGGNGDASLCHRSGLDRLPSACVAQVFGWQTTTDHVAFARTNRSYHAISRLRLASPYAVSSRELRDIHSADDLAPSLSSGPRTPTRSSASGRIPYTGGWSSVAKRRVLPEALAFARPVRMEWDCLNLSWAADYANTLCHLTLGISTVVRQRDTDVPDELHFRPISLLSRLKSVEQTGRFLIARVADYGYFWRHVFALPALTAIVASSMSLPTVARIGEAHGLLHIAFVSWLRDEMSYIADDLPPHARLETLEFRGFDSQYLQYSAERMHAKLRRFPALRALIGWTCAVNSAIVPPEFEFASVPRSASDRSTERPRDRRHQNSRGAM